MQKNFGIDDILKLLCGEYGDPHSVLGMHQQDDGLVVRVLMPGALSVQVEDEKTKQLYPLRQIHDEGLFESEIPDRTKWFPYRLEVDFGNGNIWDTKDPYSFLPSLSEYDRYLFGAGNHYEIFDKLGAHPCVMDGTAGVAFAVWAPNAKGVSVVGDFNGWDTRRGMMRLLSASGIWELFLPGACAGDRYQFAIKQNDGCWHYKTDPYGVCQELRPKKASVVYDLTGYEWQDSTWMEQRKSGEKYNRPMNIYEVHLGSWKRVPEEGNRFLTYQELADGLAAYCTQMGYTHVEILPVAEHPLDGSWGYQVTGYYAPTSRYGTPKEFMTFVDTLHQNGIGVIMDWVPAHFPKDENGLGRFDGTALYEHQDWRRGEQKQWGTYVFNYGRNEVRNFLIANALFWLERYHIDGLRVDAVASMLYLDFCRRDGEWVPNQYGGRENLEAVEFLKHMNSAVAGRHPDVYLIAEESTSWQGVTRPPEEGGLGFSLKWNMGWMNDFLSYLKKETVYRKYHHTFLTFGMMYAYSERFILVLSHDEVVHMKGSMFYKAPGDRWQKFANLRAAYGFMYTHPGKKLNFMGNDFAQYTEWSEERSIDWHLLLDADHRAFHEYMKALYQLYRQEKALWQRDFDPDGFSWVDCDDREHSIISYVRRGSDPNDFVVVVCNFTERPYEGFWLGVPEEGIYEEIFTSDDRVFGGTGRKNEGPHPSLSQAAGRCNQHILVTVPPLGMTVFRRVGKNSEKAE